jgi:hypothetical protein
MFEVKLAGETCLICSTLEQEQADARKGGALGVFTLMPSGGHDAFPSRASSGFVLSSTSPLQSQEIVGTVGREHPCLRAADSPGS